MKHFMFDLLKANRQLIKDTLFSRAAIPVLALILFSGANRKSLEIARNIYYSILVRKVGRQIRAAQGYADLANAPALDEGTPRSNRVWVYWDTGFENAPPIVRLCADRLKAFDEVEVVFLDGGNISEFVIMPPHIERKLASGVISKAHYSDLLRIELLHTFGGIWLDATVLLTGTTFPQELLGDDLFFYGMTKPASNGNPIYLSSWAISSPAGHPILSIVRTYLNEYWKRHDKILDYFMLHIALCAALNVYPELAPKKLGFHNNSSPHHLLLSFQKPYSRHLFDEIVSICDLHKLSYKYDEIATGSILDHLLNGINQPARAPAPNASGAKHV